MHRTVMALATIMAWAGGVMLLALVLLTCASIAGRELNELLQGPLGWLPGAGWLVRDVGVGAINGDFELLEAGVAFAIFAFLPLTQVTGGHATVDIFTTALPEGVQRWLYAVIEVVFALVLVLIAVQLWSGMTSKMSTGQTTLRLQFPVWWAYALAMVPAALAALVACYTAAVRVREALTGRTILPVHGEADH